MVQNSLLDPNVVELKCSVQNLIYTLLHATLQAFFCSITFQFHYIWVKQRILNHLHSSRSVQQAIRHVFVFLFSFCIIIPFKINIDIVFTAQDGFCYGKMVAIHDLLVKLSSIGGLSVFVLLIVVHLYYLYRTRKAKYKYRLEYSVSLNQSSMLSISKADIVFQLIHEQTVVFLKLFSTFLALLLVHFLILNIIKPKMVQGMVEFSVFNFCVRHYYSYVYCLILSSFRFTVSKVRLKEKYKQIRNN